MYFPESVDPDVELLHKVLSNPEIGDFQVEVLENKTSQTIREAVNRFFIGKSVHNFVPHSAGTVHALIRTAYEISPVFFSLNTKPQGIHGSTKLTTGFCF